ncbi:hypothetical protein [Halomonas rhizosphaerae]|uniref:CopG family transcriptional regulator n=1 Tax=Halomonas rhizosphaerae TaxID=3043296 RepID=A0ABT6V0M6_9GAMM|nr:hypothetical protein [Halomonas rhizosphaerae]MDI5891782.1 hypothetical protein [Halomonas rhizosphaerae]
MKIRIESEEQRETFKQDAINAWADYQATGLHATADEVTEWLTSWGAEGEVTAPVCHR